MKLTAFELDIIGVDELTHWYLHTRYLAQTSGIKEAAFKKYYQETKGIEFNSIVVNILVDQCPWTFACFDTEPILNAHNRAFSVT